MALAAAWLSDPNMIRPGAATQSLIAPGTTDVNDVNSDPGCPRNGDPGLVLGSSLGRDNTKAMVTTDITQISMVLVVAWLSDTNKATGYSPDLRIL